MLIAIEIARCVSCGQIDRPSDGPWAKHLGLSLIMRLVFTGALDCSFTVFFSTETQDLGLIRSPRKMRKQQTN